MDRDVWRHHGRGAQCRPAPTLAVIFRRVGRGQRCRTACGKAVTPLFRRQQFQDDPGGSAAQRSPAPGPRSSVSHLGAPRTGPRDIVEAGLAGLLWACCMACCMAHACRPDGDGPRLVPARSPRPTAGTIRAEVAVRRAQRPTPTPRRGRDFFPLTQWIGYSRRGTQEIPE